MYEMWVSVVTQLQTGIPAIQTGWSAIIDAFVNVNVSRMYGDGASSFDILLTLVSVFGFRYT